MRSDLLQQRYNETFHSVSPLNFAAIGATRSRHAFRRGLAVSRLLGRSQWKIDRRRDDCGDRRSRIAALVAPLHRSRDRADPQREARDRRRRRRSHAVPSRNDLFSFADRREPKMADDKNDDTPDCASKLDPAEERSQYFKKLEKWLQEAYAWQSVAAMFPYYVMSGHVVNPTGTSVNKRESFWRNEYAMSRGRGKGKGMCVYKILKHKVTNRENGCEKNWIQISTSKSRFFLY